MSGTRGPRRPTASLAIAAAGALAVSCGPPPPPTPPPPAAPPPGPLLTLEDADGNGLLDVLLDGSPAQSAGPAAGVIRDDLAGVEVLRLECESVGGPSPVWVDVDELVADTPGRALRVRATSLGLAWHHGAGGSTCEEAWEPTGTFVGTEVPAELLGIPVGKLTADGMAHSCARARLQVRTWEAP